VVIGSYDNKRPQLNMIEPLCHPPDTADSPCFLRRVNKRGSKTGRSRHSVQAIALPAAQQGLPAKTLLNGSGGDETALANGEGFGVRIANLLPTLTALEARVVAELLKKQNIDERTLLKWVADDMRVSEAMVVKIAKKLGFSGFRTFRSALAEYNNLSTTQLYADLLTHDSPGETVQKVIRTFLRVLEHNPSVIDRAAIEEAAGYLSCSVFRDFYGVGSSAQVAREAAFKFLRIGVRTSVYDDSQMMLMSACLLEKTDVAVAFSHSGQTAVIIETVRQAKRNGARMIAITNCRSSTLAQESDVVLCPNVENSLIRGETVAARIAQAIIVDALVLTLAQKSAGIAERNIRRTTSVVRRQRSFW
jgi:DNA-binding MurR/RpiR family transcriptional regulator